MATWDGSDSKPDDQNYYPYFNENVAGSTAGTWTIFPDNARNECLRANPGYYVPNEPLFEQHGPNIFYRTNTDGWPMSSVSNIYENHATSITDNARVSGDRKCFTSTVKSRQSFASNNCWKNDYDSKISSQPKHNWVERIKKTADSKLQVMAEEFVPNNVQVDGKGFCLKNTTSVNPMDSSVKDSNDISNKHTFYNTSRHEGTYNAKRNSNYRSKGGQADQFHKRDTYKHSHQRGKSSHKFHANKYFANKYYSDKSQVDEENVSTDKDTTNDSDARSSKDLSAINSNERELFTEINTNSDKKELNKGHNDEENSTITDKSVQENGTKRCNGQVKEFTTYYGFASKQFYNNRRNIKKYPYNIKYDREENSFNEKRRNRQGYNRENFSKEHKSKVKEQMCSSEERNVLEECNGLEMGLERKGINEKKYNYRKFNESKEYNKENKYETFKEKERNRGGSVFVENNEKVNEHWNNNKRESSNKNSVQKWGKNKKSFVDDDANQRERLADQLSRGQLECLVCCEYIKQNDYIWSCSNCYHVLHLKCIKKWAKSSQVENGWRCPACQNTSETIPENCYCFCGKTKAPEWNRRDVAHSCGELCGRLLSKNCTHKCTLLCHPGSCPPCTAMVTKYCGCGKTSQTVQCSGHKLLLCDSVCGKDLNCDKHKCERRCHHGECESCDKTITQKCYCGKNTREATCRSDTPLAYTCETICGKLLECGNHTCTKLCHINDCESCSLTPEKITTCCCGQTPLTEKRRTCLDPVPVCDEICSKRLKCGQPGNPHTCKGKCHRGDCPPCDLTTDVKCRCGYMDKEIACRDLTSKADDARCEKRCTKKRSCGKHKCNQLCCIEIEHVCPLVCSKTLSCGRHKCEQSCHKGRCQACWHSSFDELYCECGAAVIYPPVPCGTRRPACDKPCSRQHSCGHEVLHNCHSEPTCPPCTVLTQRWCHGKHELRKAVPCHVTEISCGLPCNKPISCGRHKCISTCHSGPCEKPGQQCTQPCTNPREMCGHVCGAPCHQGKCPETPCKEMVKVTCQCGHRSMSRVCAENSKEYQRIASGILASKMTDMQLGHSINLDQVFGQGAKKQNQLKTLECNDECKIIERNRRLALGLQIANPDLSGKLMPKYSDFMKQWAKKNPQFCQMVHDKLTELVQLAKTSKQKSRSYSFDCMNKDKRHFVHESCEHFGCESQAYDQEPKRNVVATAIKDKCWLPSYSLLEIVQRENGQRKVPGPMLNTLKTDGPIKTILSLPTQRSQKSEIQSIAKTVEPEIDYFDYHG